MDPEISGSLRQLGLHAAAAARRAFEAVTEKFTGDQLSLAIWLTAFAAHVYWKYGRGELDYWSPQRTPFAEEIDRSAISLRIMLEGPFSDRAHVIEFTDEILELVETAMDVLNRFETPSAMNALSKMSRAMGASEVPTAMKPGLDRTLAAMATMDVLASANHELPD